MRPLGLVGPAVLDDDVKPLTRYSCASGSRLACSEADVRYRSPHCLGHIFCSHLTMCAAAFPVERGVECDTQPPLPLSGAPLRGIGTLWVVRREFRTRPRTPSQWSDALRRGHV